MAKIEGGKDKRNDSRHNDYESFDDSSKSAERRPKEQLSVSYGQLLFMRTKTICWKRLILQYYYVWIPL